MTLTLPGVNNAFLVSENAELAMLYNDRSVGKGGGGISIMGAVLHFSLKKAGTLSFWRIYPGIQSFFKPKLSPNGWWCGRLQADTTVDLSFLFHKFSNFTPPPPRYLKTTTSHPHGSKCGSRTKTSSKGSENPFKGPSAIGWSIWSSQPTWRSEIETFHVSFF